MLALPEVVTWPDVLRHLAILDLGVLEVVFGPTGGRGQADDVAVVVGSSAGVLVAAGPGTGLAALVRTATGRWFRRGIAIAPAVAFSRSGLVSASNTCMVDQTHREEAASAVKAVIVIDIAIAVVVVLARLRLRRRGRLSGFGRMGGLSGCGGVGGLRGFRRVRGLRGFRRRG